MPGRVCDEGWPRSVPGCQHRACSAARPELVRQAQGRREGRGRLRLRNVQPLSLAPLQSWGGNNSPEFAFLSLLLTLCPGWSLILPGSEVPVNQAAGTSRGAGDPESTIHHLPWLTWKGRRSAGTSWGTRMAVRGGGRGLERSHPAQDWALRIWDRDFCRQSLGRRWLLQHRRAPVAGAPSHTMTDPMGERRVPGGEERGEGGGRTSQHRQ